MTQVRDKNNSSEGKEIKEQDEAASLNRAYILQINALL